MERLTRRSPLCYLFAAAGRVRVPSSKQQQPGHLERKRNKSAHRDPAAMVEYGMVLDWLCCVDSGLALDDASSSGPRFRATPGGDSCAQRSVDQSARGGTDAHFRRIARWRSATDYLPYSEAWEGETSGATRFHSDRHAQRPATTTHHDRNG